MRAWGIVAGIALAFLLAAAQGQVLPKGRQALFIQAGEKVWVYRVPPGTARVESEAQFVGSHYETQVVYINGYPIFQSVLTPDFQDYVDKLVISLGDQERSFMKPKWRLVDVLDKDGYKFLQARIDTENAANDFGLRNYDLKQKLLESLLADGKEEETQKLNLVLEIVPSAIRP